MQHNFLVVPVKYLAEESFTTAVLIVATKASHTVMSYLHVTTETIKLFNRFQNSGVRVTRSQIS